MKKNSLGLGDNERDNRYPPCPECSQKCHGCHVCGFMFCCTQCEPCHEGDNPPGHSCSPFFFSYNLNRWCCDCEFEQLDIFKPGFKLGSMTPVQKYTGNKFTVMMTFGGMF